MRRPAEAREHAAALREAGRLDADLLRVLARTETADGKFIAAGEAYRATIKLAPTDPALALEYATLLREHLQATALADAEVDRVVTASGRSPRPA